MKNNLILYCLACVLGVSAALAVFEGPRLPAAIGLKFNDLDWKLLLVGCASIVLGVFQLAFARRGRASPLIFAGLGATLIFAEIFNVGFVKFAACDVLFSGKHRHMVRDSDGALVSPEARCRKLVYDRGFES